MQLWHHKRLLCVFPELRTSVLLNPKVGSTWLKCVLWEHFLGGPIPSKRIHSAFRLAPFTAENQRSLTSARALWDPRFRRFAAVRNPYCRLISAFQDKFGRQRRSSRVHAEEGTRLGAYAEAKGLRLRDASGTLAFDTFVRWVVSQPNSLANPHWGQQSWLLLHGVVRYHKIYRFEDEFRDFALDLLTRVGASKEWVMARMTRINGSHPDAIARYTPALAEMVFEKYRRDFDAFGYEKDSWASAHGSNA